MAHKSIRGGMVDMTKGGELGHIVRFSIPLLIGNVFQQLYNMVDTVIVGHFMEDPKLAQAAVNTSFPILFLMIAMFSGLGMGATIILSQNFGAGEMNVVRRTVRTLYSGFLIVTLPLTLIGVFITPWVLRFLNVPDNIFADAQIYLTVMFVSLTGNLGYNINAGILQGLGDSRTPLRFLMIATVINIALDLLFIAVFQWGIFGIAIATIFAQGFSWLYGIYYIRKHFPELDLRPLKFSIDTSILRRALRMGLPIGVQQSLFSIGLLAMQRLINSGGDAFMAGFGNANRIDTFVFMPIMSFANALTTFTAQNMGVRNIDRVRRGLRRTLAVSISAYIVTATLVLIFAPNILWLFNKDPVVIQYGLNYLYQILPFTLLITVQFMLASVLRGAGSTMIPLLTTLVALLLVRVPSAYLLAHYAGLNYIFFSFAIGWSVGLSIAVVAYLSGRWKKRSLVMAGSASPSSPEGEKSAAEDGNSGEAVIKKHSGGEDDAEETWNRR